MEVFNKFLKKIRKKKKNIRLDKGVMEKRTKD